MKTVLRPGPRLVEVTPANSAARSGRFWIRVVDSRLPDAMLTEAGTRSISSGRLVAVTVTSSTTSETVPVSRAAGSARWTAARTGARRTMR